MRKYYFILLSFLLVQLSATAQTEQGSWIASGATNLNFLFSNSEPQPVADNVNHTLKSQDYKHNLGVGYFVADGLSLNISGSYQYSYTKEKLFSGAYPGDNNPVYELNEQTSWGIIPSLAYIFPVEGSIKPKVELGFGYLVLKERDNQESREDKVVSHFNGPSLNLGAGAAFFLNKSVSLDLGFQYSRNKLKNKLQTNQSVLQELYGVVAGVSLYF